MLVEGCVIRVDVPAERKGRVGVTDDKSKAFSIRAVFNHSGREGMAQHVRRYAANSGVL